MPINILYPAKIDDNTSIPDVVDNVTPINAEVLNRLKAAVLAVERELGVKPSSVYGTVKARLDSIEGNLIVIGGDLSQTLSGQLVIGFQGRPLSSAAPTTGQILGWTGTTWAPIVNTGGSGAFSPAGDLAGTGFNQTVVGIRTIGVSSTLPNTINQVLVYDGYQYTPTLINEDMVQPGFNITGFSGGLTVEVGQTITTPVFTASYSTAPDATTNSVVLTDDDGNAPKDVTSTPTSFSSNFNYTKNTFNASVTWTDTAKKGTITRTSITTAYWWQNNYYGKGPTGQTSESFIESLTGFLSNTRNTTFNVTASPGEYIYYCFRSAYGTPTFTVGGFSGGFNLIGTTSVTNAHGFTENYDIYQSSNDNLGATTVVVT